MELRLNVYKIENGVKTIEKTYKANDYEIMFGTVEDIIDALELDKITNNKLTNDDLTNIVFKALGKGIPQISVFLQDIFPGLTREELKRAKVSEVKNVILGVVQNAFK